MSHGITQALGSWHVVFSDTNLGHTLEGGSNRNMFYTCNLPGCDSMRHPAGYGSRNTSVATGDNLDCSAGRFRAVQGGAGRCKVVQGVAVQPSSRSTHVVHSSLAWTFSWHYICMCTLNAVTAYGIAAGNGAQVLQICESFERLEVRCRCLQCHTSCVPLQAATTHSECASVHSHNL